MSSNSDFSSETELLTGDSNKNPFVFPFIMLGTALVLGTALTVVNAENLLVQISATPETAASTLMTLGGVAITMAHGHSMLFVGNSRRKFKVPHPMMAPPSNTAFWNANRGYYNMTEHFPFFLFNMWLARESGAPCIAGASCVAFGIGRILYTQGYAYGGPGKRGPGFMLATMSSMACLGVALLNSALFPF